MKRAGVLRLPLFFSPYKLPEDVRNQFGQFTFDPGSPEPWFQTNKGGSFNSVWPQPFTYGLNKFGPTGLNGVSFNGNVTTGLEARDTDYATHPAQYRVRYGNSYYKGGAEGEVWTGNPVGAVSDWQDNGAPGGLPNNYIDLYGSCDMPNSIDLVTPDGRTIRVLLRVAGRKPSTAVFYLDYDVDYLMVGSDQGGHFDSPNDVAWRAVYGPTFRLVFARWEVGNFALWLNGGSCTFSQRGMLVEGGNKSGFYQSWEGAHAVPIDRQGDDPAWGFAVLPSQLVFEDDPTLNATIGAINNGFFPVATCGPMFSGQAFTPVLFDPAGDQYWPVEFIPKSKLANDVISTANSPSMKYSAEGYLMLTMSNLPEFDGIVFHTDALSTDLEFPTLPKVHPLDLPCFNPCVPNLTLEKASANAD